MYGQRPQGENGTGGYGAANGAAGWWGREGGGYMNVVAAMPHPQYHHEQGFDPQTCINLKGFEFSDLDHALLGDEPAMRSHAARLHQLGQQQQQQQPGHGHAVQGFHQDATYLPHPGGIMHRDPAAKFTTYQHREEYHAQQIPGGERQQVYRNGNSAEYSQFVGMHPTNVALKHHPGRAVYQGMVEMPSSVPGQFVRTQEDEAAARTQPTDHWQQHRNFSNQQALTSQPVHTSTPLQNSHTAMDSFEKIAQTELRMRMLYAQQSAAAQQRSMLSPVHANSTPSPAALQKPCAAGASPWQPAPLVSRSSSISSTHSNLSGASGQCFSPCMQQTTPTPVPQSPCGTVPRSPCQQQHPPHRSPNLSSLRVVQEEGSRWPGCEQPPTQQVMQTVSPQDTANPLLERQAWDLQQQGTVLNSTEREHCGPGWSPNFPASAEPQNSVLPSHIPPPEEGVFASQEGLQVGYGSLPKVEREVEIPRLQMASPPVPYHLDISRLDAKDQNFQRQIQVVQNTQVEERVYPYQHEQSVPESPSFSARHGDHFYPGFSTQSGLPVPSVSNTEGPKEVLPPELVVSQEQRLSHPAVPLIAEHETEGMDTKANAAPSNFLWPSEDASKSEQALNNGSQLPTAVVNNYREAVASELPVESARPRTQNVLAALSTACHNLITNLQRSTYNLYDTVGKEERLQNTLEHGGMIWDSNGQVNQELWKAEIEEGPPMPHVGSSDDLLKAETVFIPATDNTSSQANCNRTGSAENEVVPSKKRRASEDNILQIGKKLKSEGADVMEQRKDGNIIATMVDKENNDFTSTFPTQNGKGAANVHLSSQPGVDLTTLSYSQSDTTSGNPAALQNADTSLHLTIVNGNVYPASASGTSLQPVQVTAAQKETSESDSHDTKICDRNLPYEAESIASQVVAAPFYEQQSSSEALGQSESRTESDVCASGFDQDGHAIQPPENSVLNVKPDQEDTNGGDSRPVHGEDRHPLEILQAQIRLQQQQFNLAPAEATSTRPSSAPCTTDSKEALLEDTWYQPSSPAQDDTTRAPWEKNREKMIKMEELEPGSVDRRLLHKLNEQRRRDSLKSAIYCLKQAIPDCRDSSDQSQQNVLNKANNFILEMLDKQRQADQCKEEVQSLRARNVALQQNIAALQREYTRLSKHP